MKRQPDGRPSIYEGADKLFHCWVTVGTKPDGTPHRKHIKRGTAPATAAAVDKLMDRLKANGGVATGKIETVADWLRHWLETNVRGDRAYTTWRSYRTAIELHIIPAIGAKRLDGNRNVLEPEDVERLYETMRRKKISPSYILQVHRILSRALKVAHRRGKAGRNVCTLIDGPSVRRRKMTGISLPDAQAILREAAADPMAPRWLLGLLLGPRQGECLGLQWPDVHLDDAPHVRIQTQLQRHAWEHGCTDPEACAQRHCRTRPCPPRYEHGCTDRAVCKKLAHWCPRKRQVPGCSAHRGRDGCPPPCRPGCTDHARACKQRHGGGLVQTDVKSEHGDRIIPLPPVVAESLRALRERTIRQYPGTWPGTGFVFTGPGGRPLDPRRDHGAWEKLLARAGVADDRLHAARHGAASMLLASGTDIAVVQELLGHSDIRVTRGYVDVAAELKQQAVTRLAEALLDGDLRVLLQPPSTSAGLQRGLQ